MPVSSRVTPGMLPGCGSRGPPCWSCQSWPSFGTTSAVSSNGVRRRGRVSPGELDVLPGAEADRDDQVTRVRRELAVDGRVPERRERDDEGVELAAPVVHAVEGGVRDQDVAAGAAEGEVAVAEARIGVLRVVVLAAVGEQVVVELQQVVAEAAEQPVAVRAADDPVVAVVAEERSRPSSDLTSWPFMSMGGPSPRRPRTDRSSGTSPGCIAHGLFASYFGELRRRPGRSRAGSCRAAPGASL